MQDKNCIFFDRNKEDVNRLVKFFFSFPENENYRGNEEFLASNYYDETKVSYQFIKTVFQFFDSKKSSKTKEYFIQLLEKENIPDTFHSFLAQLSSKSSQKSSSFLDFSVPNYNDLISSKKGPPPSKQWKKKTEDLKRKLETQEYNEMVYPVLHSIKQSNKFFNNSASTSSNEDIRWKQEISSSYGAGLEIFLTMATLGFLFYVAGGIVTRGSDNSGVKRILWCGFGLISGFIVEVILIIIRLSRQDEEIFEKDGNNPKRKAEPKPEAQKVTTKKKVIQVLPPRIKEESENEDQQILEKEDSQEKQIVEKNKDD